MFGGCVPAGAAGEVQGGGQGGHAPEVLERVPAQGRRGATGFVPAQVAHLAGAQAFRRVPGFDLADRGGQVGAVAARDSPVVGAEVEGEARRERVQELVEAGQPGELPAKHGELLTEVKGGGRAVGEIPWADQDDLVRDGFRWKAALGEGIAQGEHVHRGLDRGGGHLGPVVWPSMIANDLISTTWNVPCSWNAIRSGSRKA